MRKGGREEEGKQEREEKKKEDKGGETGGRGEWKGSTEELCKHLPRPSPLQFSTLINSVKALEEDPVACANSRWPQGCREVTFDLKATVWHQALLSGEVCERLHRHCPNAARRKTSWQSPTPTPGSREWTETILSAGRYPTTGVGKNLV